MSVLNQSGDDAVECPLCMEPLEVDDLNFFPCTCGYQICRFCWHRIRTDENGLCPACRKAYSENPADFKPLSKEEISRLKAEKRLKDQQRKQRLTENRKHLANVRVVQKNLVFVVGLPMRLADADVLKKHEYFGKFGKIHKVVINQSTAYAGSQGPSASAYVTYQRPEDALRAIEAVNNITVDSRTIKTSLGTTKYCSHFMRNQVCPKPDCMYLHDLGDQEASFTKEEMHQGKHQDYERKLVQSLHAHASTPPTTTTTTTTTTAAAATTNRKPTISPPVGSNPVRENGAAPAQLKEAWPSLQPGQANSASTPLKDPSLTQNLASSSESELTAVSNQSATSTNNSSQNNNNKGEGKIASNSRRGKSNSESKAQAVRNKHKNTQNKEKHGNSTRTTSRSESSSSSSGTGSRSSDRAQVNGQKQARSDITNGAANSGAQLSTTATTTAATTTETTTTTTPNGRCKSEQNLNNHHHNHHHHASKEIEQSLQEMQINGITRNGDQCHSESESEPQREGSTPASTASSGTSEDSASNNTGERLIDGADDISDSAELLSSSPITSGVHTASSISGSQVGIPPGIHTSNGIQTQLSHRSIFQTDNNSFFSSNTFQKISSLTVPPAHSTSASADWTTTCLAQIPDSLPTVHSSEDWQAAFGFQPEKCRPNHQGPPTPSSSPSVPFNAENFLDDDDYPDSHYGTPPSKLRSCDSSVIVNSSPHSASKFMADFQQNSRQQRLVLQAQQNHDNREFIKHNGHVVDNSVKSQDSDIKSDDELGFDPFHETQKALAELMENEIQLHQQRLYQQQQQQQHQQQHQQHQHQQQQQQQQQQLHQQSREELSRSQHQGFTPNIGPQHFSQVAHLAHLQQQAHLQNIQALQQSHTLLSRLPQNMLQQSSVQNNAPPNMLVGNSLGQRSRLPPPGFPSSTPNHMNSFGLGIPRAAPTTNILPGAQPQQQTSYLPNGNPLITQQGMNKCSSDSVYCLKDWCDMTSQPQSQPSVQPFHHQPMHQKGGWNNFGPVADWPAIDPAIVTSSKPPPFQPNNTWQFSRFHPTPLHSVPHSAQQEQPAQHWAMQPPPGFGGQTSSGQLNGQQSGTAAQSHTKLISAGPDIENC